MIYWRKEARVDLPNSTIVKRSLEDPDMYFIGPEKDMQLAIYVDAAHGTDIKTRWSISGVIDTLNGTAIAYRAKWQNHHGHKFNGS